jgi:hypothetical protein
MRQWLDIVFWFCFCAAWYCILSERADIASYWIVIMTASIIGDLVIGWRDSERQPR